MRVDLILRKLLTATADKTAAERRIARYRDTLDTEARRRFVAEGAAPTWKAPKLGNVRLDPKDAKPYIDDPVAFASYVAERHPDETDATIAVPTAQLAAALEALTFAGVADVTATVTVREPFGSKLLAELEVREDNVAAADSDEAVDVVRTAIRIVDEETGEVETVPGVKVTDPSATLVVTLDPDARRRVIADADAAVDTEERDEAVAEDLAPDEAAAQESALTTDPDLGDRLADAVVDLVNALDGHHPDDRRPYVEDDPDPVSAALRSADIDREELDTLPTADQLVGASPAEKTAAAERRAHLAESALRWDAQAARARDAQLVDEPPLIDPSYPAAGHGRAPAPELSAAERAIVDRFEAAPNALTLDAEEVCLETGGEPLTAGEPGTVEAIGDELDARYRTDDLKRIARRRRLPVAGTKAALARRLAEAGVTLDEALTIVDRTGADA